MDNKRRTRSVYRFDTEKEREEATRIKNKIYYDKNKISGDINNNRNYAKLLQIFVIFYKVSAGRYFLT